MPRLEKCTRPDLVVLPARKRNPRRRTAAKAQAAEIQAIYGRMVAQLDQMAAELKRIAAIPQAPTVEDAGEDRPFTLLEWVLSEADIEQEHGPFGESLRCLRRAATITQADLDQMYREDRARA